MLAVLFYYTSSVARAFIYKMMAPLFILRRAGSLRVVCACVCMRCLFFPPPFLRALVFRPEGFVSFVYTVSAETERTQMGWCCGSSRIDRARILIRVRRVVDCRKC